MIAFILLFALGALFIGTVYGMIAGLAYLVTRFIRRRELRAQGIAWWK